MGSKKAAPTTGALRVGLLPTRCFCSLSTVTAMAAKAATWSTSPDARRLRSSPGSCCGDRTAADRPGQARRVPRRSPIDRDGRRSTRRWKARGAGLRHPHPGQRRIGESWRSRTCYSGHRARHSRTPLVRIQERPVSRADLAGRRPDRVKWPEESNTTIGELFPTRRLHRDESPAPESCRRAVLQQARDGGVMDLAKASKAEHTGRACRVTGSGRMRSGCS